MIYFIVNPTAGGGRAEKRIDEIHRFMNKDYKILKTNGPMDAKYLSQEAIQNGAKAIIAVGGDGTVHEVISGIAESDITFGLIAAGSGNDFAKSIGCKASFNTAAYIELIHQKKPERIDIIQMGEFYFANIGSIGLDAEIVSSAVALKPKLGKFAYIASTLKNTMTFGSMKASYTISDNAYNSQPQAGEFTLIAICNGAYYGGGYKVAPTAKVNDGLITVCTIDKMPKWLASLLFPAVLFGVHPHLKQVKMLNCKELSLNYDGMRIVNLDGNIYKLKAPLNFKLIKNGLEIFR